MTLQRVLEPEVMDTLEEARDYDSMDHDAVNQLFVDDLLAVRAELGDVLDLGTGTAQIPIRLCRQEEACRVMAVDLAAHMLDLARLNLEIAGLTHRVQLSQVDAKALSFPPKMFDVVMSNSIIHHLPEPLVGLSEAVRVVKPGGLLFFRDLMRPQTQSQLDELVTAYAGHENEHQRKMFAESLHAALSLEEIRELVAGLGFDPQSVTATSDRHWTWIAEASTSA